MPERTRCGMPCLIHDHDCDRSPNHTAMHRDVQQKGNHTCEWATPGVRHMPALIDLAKRLRRERADARAEAERLRDQIKSVQDHAAWVEERRRTAERERDEARRHRLDDLHAMRLALKAALGVDGDPTWDQVISAAQQTLAGRDRLAEQVKRVRDRHQPVAAHLGDPDDDDNLITACSDCEVPYPCPTVRTLDEEATP